jgi:hypothetical protein
VNDNASVELHPTNYVNDPFVIAQNDRMVAINSAIEVDLTGQVCADSIGRAYTAASAARSISSTARPARRRRADHRPAQHGAAKNGTAAGQPHHGDAQERRGRHHHPQPRALRRYRTRRRRPVWQDHRAARPGADQIAAPEYRAALGEEAQQLKYL